MDRPTDSSQLTVCNIYIYIYIYICVCVCVCVCIVNSKHAAAIGIYRQIIELWSNYCHNVNKYCSWPVI